MLCFRSLVAYEFYSYKRINIIISGNIFFKARKTILLGIMISGSLVLFRVTGKSSSSTWSNSDIWSDSESCSDISSSDEEVDRNPEQSRRRPYLALYTSLSWKFSMFCSFSVHNMLLDSERDPESTTLCPGKTSIFFFFLTVAFDFFYSFTEMIENY